MNIITSALKRRLLPVSAVFLAACTVGFSQTTSEVTASDKAKDAEVLKLNPFTVSGQKEVGYGTSRTMSGNRTNKSLLELPTAID
jgi:outer membrane biogenesis lipoprotein LolB